MTELDVAEPSTMEPGAEAGGDPVQQTRLAAPGPTVSQLLNEAPTSRFHEDVPFSVELR